MTASLSRTCDQNRESALPNPSLWLRKTLLNALSSPAASRAWRPELLRVHRVLDGASVEVPGGDHRRLAEQFETLGFQDTPPGHGRRKMGDGDVEASEPRHVRLDPAQPVEPRLLRAVLAPS
ncbi:hypothetical protein AB0C84_35780 [Actinomadura sp. NPDC048955]|uniref:hypothetical protein n=1 Tax=Actinomadura sp. NPDC048955 TaxID=3158228 RepID=UPI0033D4A85E